MQQAFDCHGHLLSEVFCKTESLSSYGTTDRVSRGHAARVQFGVAVRLGSLWLKAGVTAEILGRSKKNKP